MIIYVKKSNKKKNQYTGRNRNFKSSPYHWNYSMTQTMTGTIRSTKYCSQLTARYQIRIPGSLAENLKTDTRHADDVLYKQKLYVEWFKISLNGTTVNNHVVVNTKKYHVFAPMGRFQLVYFPPSSNLVYLCFCPVGLSLL
jgi:hypothetical protein